MYLKGEKFHWTDWDKPEGNRRTMQDGFAVSETILSIGYWRKHPNLHGYIVQEFADGKDDCERIDLSKEDLENILKAIKENRLPKTSGFFFGSSDESMDQKSIEIIQKAIAWLEAKDEKVSRSVFYQASW